MVFHWNLSYIMSFHMSMTLLSIQADHNDTVISIFSICPLIYYSFQTFQDSSKCTYNNWYPPSPCPTAFLLPLPDQSSNLSFRFFFFNFTRQSQLHSKFTLQLSLAFFFSTGTGDMFLSHIPRLFCASDSSGRILVCAYTI